MQTHRHPGKHPTSHSYKHIIRQSKKGIFTQPISLYRKPNTNTDNQIVSQSSRQANNHTPSQYSKKEHRFQISQPNNQIDSQAGK